MHFVKCLDKMLTDRSLVDGTDGMTDCMERME